jgi:hypothetical protein
MDVKLIILLWYFHGCLEHMYRALLEKPGFGNSVKAEEVSEMAKKTRAWRKKSEMAMDKARKTLVNSYSDKDESVDRLAFLGIELGVVETEDEDLQLVRQRCLRFLSNFTYICSWGMSRPDTAALWRDLGASCVICATTLDMRSKIMSEDIKEEDVAITNKAQKTQPTVASPSSPILRIGIGGLEDSDPAKAKSDG